MGLYNTAEIIFFQIRGVAGTYHANHYIFIDGQKKTYTGEEDSSTYGIDEPSGSTSIVLRLTVGQQVHVAPYGSGTVDTNNYGYMYSWFQATLLNVD